MAERILWNYLLAVAVLVIAAGLSPIVVTPVLDVDGSYAAQSAQIDAMAEPFLFSEPVDVLVFIGAGALVVGVVAVIGLLDGLYQQQGETE